MADIKYTDDHEYLKIDGDVATIGITKYAKEQLGDVVFVELPEVGKVYAKGDEAAVVESVKAAAELYAPVSGEVVDANGDLEGNPGLVNEDPEGGAWFIKMKLADVSELEGMMDAEGYAKFVEEQG
jgi:glycine cleavage system H protein